MPYLYLEAKKLIELRYYGGMARVIAYFINVLIEESLFGQIALIWHLLVSPEHNYRCSLRGSTGETQNGQKLQNMAGNRRYFICILCIKSLSYRAFTDIFC